MSVAEHEEQVAGKSVAICMPQDQQDGTRAVLGACLKQPGDTVQAHEPIAEVETDKVVVEVAAPHDGVLSEWCYEVGDELTPGCTLARLTLATGEEQAPADLTAAIPSAGGRAQSNDARQRLSPAVKRLLADHQLTLEQLLTSVRGSGRDGRLSAADVRRYLADQGQQAKVPEGPPAPADECPEPAPVLDADEASARRVPISPMRRAIAEHMCQSLLHTAPHVTTVFECDMSRVLAHRKANRDSYRDRGAELTLTTYFLAAAAQALRKVPEVNSSMDGNELLLWDEINVGVAVALGGDGLVVPVLRGVHQMNLFGIAKGLAEITDRARARTLGPEEMQGGTFTISNHGVSGSLLAAPVIINQPQSAILGIGKLRKEVVVREVDGEDLIRIAPMCYLTLSLDHRVLDAYTANAFLSELVSMLEGWDADQE